MDAARGGELFECNGAGGVEAASVDPVLDAIEVYGGQLGGEAGKLELAYVHCAVGDLGLLVSADVPVLEASRAMHHVIRRLSTVEAYGHFTMLFLTFVPAPRCLAIAAGGPAPDANALVVCAFVVGQGGEDGGGALLTQARVQERRKRLVGWLQDGGRSSAQEL